MAVGLKEKKLTTLILIVVVGIVMGAYLNSLVTALIPGKNNVVKTFFATKVTFGIGDFSDNRSVVLGVDAPGEEKAGNRLQPLVIDLGAIKLQLGIQFAFSAMSVVGIFLSLYSFRWYK